MQKLTCIFLAFSIFITSCRPILEIKDKVITDLPETKRLIDVKYQLADLPKPSFANPSINLTFQKFEKFEVKTIITKDEHRDWSNPKGAAGTIGVLSWIAGLIVASDTDDDPNTTDNEAKEGDTSLGWIIALSGTPFIIWGLAQQWKTVRKNKVSDGELRTFEETAKPYVVSVNVTNTLGLSKTFNTSIDRRLSLNLLTDLGLDYFQNTEMIDLSFTIKDFKENKLEYKLDLSTYLKKYAQVKVDVACLRETPSIRAKSVTGMPVGGKAKFVKEVEGWVEVLLNDQYKGYLRSADVDTYYSREIQVESKTINCSDTKSFIQDKATDFLSIYYEALTFIGNPLNDKEDKEIAISKTLKNSFKDPTLLIINDLNISNKKLKYRKAQEYFMNIPGTFKELKFKHSIIDFKYDTKTGSATARVKRSIEGTHFEDGFVSDTSTLIYKFRFKIDNYEFKEFYIEDILVQDSK